mgnify:CR=1 FL=1
MENLLLSSISIDSLKAELSDTIRKEISSCLADFQPKQPDTDFITRKEAAVILGVSLPTLAKWTLNGIIPAYRISSRIRYKKSEVEESLLKIRSLKG